MKLLRYHTVCLDLIKKIQSQHDIQSIIDIGGKSGFFVSGTTIRDKTSLDKAEHARWNRQISYEACPKDVGVIKSDFLTWEVNKKYDIATCMQTLEHITDKNIINFTQKLFDLSDHLIISIPYKWEKGACKYHCQDPVDKQKLFSWTGRKPDEHIIVKDSKRKRMIAYYKLT